MSFWIVAAFGAAFIFSGGVFVGCMCAATSCYESDMEIELEKLRAALKISRRIISDQKTLLARQK